MRNILFFCVFMLGASSIAAQNPVYDQVFTPERLRIDLIFSGNAQSQQLHLKELLKEPLWGGSKTQLIDELEYGQYFVKVFTKDQQLIYSRGFNTLFEEWRTTAEAKTHNKAFSGTFWMPFPKNPVDVVFYERSYASGAFEEWQRISIDPSNKLIRQETPLLPAEALIMTGDPAVKVDLVFVAEGYTAAEMDKFRADAKRFTDYLFKTEPYNNHKNDFNIWLAPAPSIDSGTDIPQQDIWKHTAISSSFYTFYIDRYLTAPDQTAIANVLGSTPFDAIYVIVNDSKYGGGGIYNFYGLSTADHPSALPVFVHELGHSFAGLADEYYTSDVAYEDFYNLKVEPWEPNITTLVNFSAKWDGMMSPGTPRPTPANPEYNTTVGLFEGGGYMAKGIYRPHIDCRMKSNAAPGFCPVCQAAITRMIQLYNK